MFLLVIDNSAEEQARLAGMVESLPAADRESMDLRVTLSSPSQALGRITQCDVVIIGATMGEDAMQLARQIKRIASGVEIIVLASPQNYTSDFFKQATAARVRKILPARPEPLDVLQELVAIHTHFNLTGRTRRGRLVVFFQAKGGLGATSLIAGLGEHAHREKCKTLLWDLDIESQDLSRGLNAQQNSSDAVTQLVSTGVEISADMLRSALLPVSSHVSLLPPPGEIAAGIDLVTHPDSIKLVQRIVELGRFSHDAIVVDATDRITSSTGTLLRLADQIVILFDGTVAGVSSAAMYLEKLRPILKSNFHAIRMLCPVTRTPLATFARAIDPEGRLDDSAWSLPMIPMEPAAQRWHGSGKTIFSLGNAKTREFFQLLGARIALGAPGSAEIHQFPERRKELGWSGALLQSVLGKASNA